MDLTLVSVLKLTPSFYYYCDYILLSPEKYYNIYFIINVVDVFNK